MAQWSHNTRPQGSRTFRHLWDIGQQGSYRRPGVPPRAAECLRKSLEQQWVHIPMLPGTSGVGQDQDLPTPPPLPHHSYKSDLSAREVQEHQHYQLLISSCGVPLGRGLRALISPKTSRTWEPQTQTPGGKSRLLCPQPLPSPPTLGPLGWGLHQAGIFYHIMNALEENRQN